MIPLIGGDYMSKVQCPVCGRVVESETMVSLDNGSPACPECAEKEQKYAENSEMKEEQK